MQVAECLPQAKSECEQEAGETERRSDVIAEELGIPEDVAGTDEMICVPSQQRRERDHEGQHSPNLPAVFAASHACESDDFESWVLHAQPRGYQAKRLPGCERCRSEDSGFFSKSCQREPDRYGYRAVFDVSAQAPENKPSGGKIHLCQRTLREEDWIQRSANCRGDCNLCIGGALGEAKHAQQRESCDHHHGRASYQRSVADHLPPKGDPRQNERWMPIRERRVRNQASGEQDVAGSRNIVTSFVPIVGQLQQGYVQQEDKNENDSEDQGRMRIGGSHEIRNLTRAEAHS